MTRGILLFAYRIIVIDKRRGEELWQSYLTGQEAVAVRTENKKIWFSCHPEDRERVFVRLTEDILKLQNCAIWYDAELEADDEVDDLLQMLGQMQLFVIPVTGETGSCCGAVSEECEGSTCAWEECFSRKDMKRIFIPHLWGIFRL